MYHTYIILTSIQLEHNLCTNNLEELERYELIYRSILIKKS